MTTAEDRLRVLYQEVDPSEITGGLQMSLGHLLTVGNNNRASLRS